MLAYVHDTIISSERLTKEIITGLWFWYQYLSRKKLVVLIVALIGTAAYEVFLFEYLFFGEKKNFTFSAFFAYTFSIAGAIPLALILAWIGGEATKYGDVTKNFGDDELDWL